MNIEKFKESLTEEEKAILKRVEKIDSENKHLVDFFIRVSNEAHHDY